MRPATISVIVPCYNAEGFILETLDSILEQSYPHVEILIVDDGSTDRTRDVLEPYRDGIHYLEIPNSGGPSRPRNIGLGQATGDLVSFCDADDLMLPEKLAAAVQVFHDYPQVDFLFTNFQSCDESGLLIEPNFLAEYQEFRRHLKPAGKSDLGLLAGTDVYRSLLRANFIGTSSVVCRARVFEAVGHFDEAMPNSEDLNLWRRIARAGHAFAFLDQVHHIYRIRPGSISHGESVRYPALIQGCEKELPYCDRADDFGFLRNKIHRLWLGYGYALRQEGKRGEAVAAYRTALGQKISWSGIKGLVLSSLARKQ